MARLIICVSERRCLTCRVPSVPPFMKGWTGIIELTLGHYGFEADEAFVVIFVGVVPVVIDVCFKYWIFVGLNKISPGAVVTIKQVDTH